MSLTCFGLFYNAFKENTNGSSSSISPNPFFVFLNQVEHEFIYYVHDGSETVADSFTVGANDTGLRKHSEGQTVYVQVTAVNDEPPVITANRVLRVSVHV